MKFEDSKTFIPSNIIGSILFIGLITFLVFMDFHKIGKTKEQSQVFLYNQYDPQYSSIYKEPVPKDDLNTYKILDKKKGIYQIPINEAMMKLVDDSLKTPSK